MKDVHNKLIKIIELIESHYSKHKINSNLYLLLHLCECSFDYGPLYTFWYFLFEWINGLLNKSNLFFRAIIINKKFIILRQLTFISIVNENSYCFFYNLCRSVFCRHSVMLFAGFKWGKSSWGRQPESFCQNLSW